MALLSVPVMVAGWWFLRAQRLYGDPLAWDVHLLAKGASVLRNGSFILADLGDFFVPQKLFTTASIEKSLVYPQGFFPSGKSHQAARSGEHAGADPTPIHEVCGDRFVRAASEKIAEHP